MSNSLYNDDYSTWFRIILQTSSEKASNREKLLALVLPELLEDAYEHQRNADKGTFCDAESRIHLRMRFSHVARVLGWERHAVGASFKTLHNNGVVDYRYFTEIWQGNRYNLSYVYPLDRLWQGNIGALPGNERNKGYKQKNYTPTCIKCYGTFQKRTGGIEYECLSCHNRHIYYPRNDS